MTRFKKILKNPVEFQSFCLMNCVYEKKKWIATVTFHHHITYTLNNVCLGLPFSTNMYCTIYLLQILLKEMLHTVLQKSCENVNLTVSTLIYIFFTYLNNLCKQKYKDMYFNLHTHF